MVPHCWSFLDWIGVVLFRGKLLMAKASDITMQEEVIIYEGEFVSAY